MKASETIHGFCAVPQCERTTYMGWCPLAVPQDCGKQICQFHWDRHKDEGDSFNLFDVFNFARPVIVPKPKPAAIKPIAEPEVKRCACGAALSPRYRYCSECAAERERERQAKRRQKTKAEPIEVSGESRKCRRCSRERQAGYSYCAQCAKSRELDRKRKWAKKKRQSVYTV